MRKRLHVKYPLFLSDFNKTWRMDKETNMTKIIIAFRNIANAPNNDKPSQFHANMNCQYGDLAELWAEGR